MVEKCETYLFEYYHDGCTWCFEIQASSVDDARERLNKLPRALFLGTLQMKMPVELGAFARLLCWLRNRFTARP
jgi:hypothetical protein